MSARAPSALCEVRAARQIPGEGRRRWFTSHEADLFVWFDDAGAISGFQFCYDKHTTECALTCRRDSGFVHQGVDTGNWSGGMKATPVLAASARWNAVAVLQRFRRVSGELPDDVRAFVDTAIAAAVRRPRSVRRRRMKERLGQ